jgi:superfamily II DNA or RNA helicase
MATFNDFISSLSPEAHVRGKQFEVFVKWFLSNDPEWAANVEKVWLWDEWPERWGPDCGIDLVFSHSDGSTWAVQAKCYDSKYQITKKDVDTFLSESNRPIINNRLLISSTDLINSKAARTCADQEKPVTIFKLQDFQQSPIDYPNNFELLYEAKVKDQPQPRPHQREAIDAVVAGLKEHDRGQLIMACGTGKTFTTLWIKEALKPNLALVLLPSLSLLSQTMREWAWGGRDKFKILNICSDTSVGKKTEDMSVSEAPYPVTSDPEVIKRFMLSGEDRIIFCTYHSSPLIAEVQSDAGVPDFDLIIGDEAHRCAGKADSAFTTVLDGNVIRSHKRLFTTATPRMYGSNVKAAARESGAEMYGMDDVSAFGPELHRLSFGQAIEQELLTDYQVVVIGVTEPMVKAWIDEQMLLDTGSDIVMDARSLAAKVGVLKAIKDYNLERIISFHSKVASAKQFASEINELLELIPDNQKPEGAIWSDYVSGTMSAADRKVRIDRLKALSDHNIGVLTNARCLSEGVDVPSLDGVAFVDPRGSQIDIIQAVGRAIRRSENKEKGTIVIPVFIGFEDGFEEELEGSAYQPIWAVIKALRSHDESLGDLVDHYRQELGRKGCSIDLNMGGKLVVDLPYEVPASFTQSLISVLVEKTSSSWEFNFGRLQKYWETYNSSRVVKSKADELALANLEQWVTAQRSKYSADQLIGDRCSRLEAFPDWTWDVNQALWDEAISYLSMYAESNGDAAVPVSYKTEDGYKLGAWVTKQRSEYASGKLSELKVKQLESFRGWVWDLLDHRWEVGFKYLSEYVSQHGNARLLRNNYETSDGFKLGQWCQVQRNYRSTTSAERQKRLESLSGWAWDRLEAQWNEGFEELSAYLAEHGDLNIPQRYVSHTGFKLGQWVTVQRSRKNELPKSRRSKLESMPEWLWDPKRSGWNKGLIHLLQYVEAHGNSNVPQKHETEDGFKLGGWVTNVRQRYKKAQLESDQVAAIEQIKDWCWDPKDQQWELGYARLVRYVSTSGNASPASSFVDDEGFRLGQWVGECRSSKVKGTLSKERIDRLERLDGWVWNALDAAWASAYCLLEEYFRVNGDARVKRGYVTEDNFKLGEWVKTQRDKKQVMSPERIELLNRLNFIWDASKHKGKG